MRMYQGLKPEQAAVVQRAADLSRELFAKRAEQHDRTGKFPLENYADLHKAGLLGLTVPKEYGGVGADWVTFALTMLEIAKVDRKSTRLNSSHGSISYAVFCLKKKNKTTV